MRPFYVAGFFIAITSAAIPKRQVDPEFSGSGNILVYEGQGLNTSSDPFVGCLTERGGFITLPADDLSKCGVFTRQDEDPGSLKSSLGNCAFADTNHVENPEVKDKQYQYLAFICPTETKNVVT